MKMKYVFKLLLLLLIKIMAVELMKGSNNYNLNVNYSTYNSDSIYTTIVVVKRSRESCFNLNTYSAIPTDIDNNNIDQLSTIIIWVYLTGYYKWMIVMMIIMKFRMLMVLMNRLNRTIGNTYKWEEYEKIFYLSLSLSCLSYKFA